MFMTLYWRKKLKLDNYDNKNTKISEKISKPSLSVGFIVPKGFGGVGIPLKLVIKKNQRILQPFKNHLNHPNVRASYTFLVAAKM